jgi:hypothetical protein
MRRDCLEVNLPGNILGNPRSRRKESVVVFDADMKNPHVKAQYFLDECPKMSWELAMLWHEILSLSCFSIWLCDPVIYCNDKLGLVVAINFFIQNHMGEDEVDEYCASVINVYYHFRTVRGPTIYNRYK